MYEYVDTQRQLHLERRARLFGIQPRKPIVIPEPVDTVVPVGPEPAPMPMDDDPLVLHPRGWWKVVVNEVCDKYGVSQEDLCGDRRGVYLVRARHEAYFRIRMETGLSFPDIGNRLHRDHTSIQYGVRKHIERVGSGERKPLEIVRHQQQRIHHAEAERIIKLFKEGHSRAAIGKMVCSGRVIINRVLADCWDD